MRFWGFWYVFSALKKSALNVHRFLESMLNFKNDKNLTYKMLRFGFFVKNKTQILVFCKSNFCHFWNLALTQKPISTQSWFFNAENTYQNPQNLMKRGVLIKRSTVFVFTVILEVFKNSKVGCVHRIQRRLPPRSKELRSSIVLFLSLSCITEGIHTHSRFGNVRRLGTYHRNRREWLERFESYSSESSTWKRVSFCVSFCGMFAWCEYSKRNSRAHL